MLQALKARVARSVRTAGLVMGGLACLLVGVAFLTTALWIALALAHGAATASLIVGCGYVGLGLVAFGIASRSAQPPARPDPVATPQNAGPNADLAALVLAFLTGIQAGAKSRRRD